MTDPFERRPWRAFSTGDSDVAAAVTGLRGRRRRRNEALLAATAAMVVIAGLAAAALRPPGATDPVGLTATGTPTAEPSSTASAEPSPTSAAPSSVASADPSESPQSETPGEPASSPGDSTGVSSNTLRIAMHVAFTGSSALPAQRLADAARAYWAGRAVFGRSVQVEVVDDTNRAAPCRDLTARNFLVMAIANPVVVAGCAATPAMKGTPYLTPGIGLDGTSHPGYFAVSATPTERAGTIRALTGLDGSRAGSWAVVIPDTPDGTARGTALTTALTNAGRQSQVFRTSKAPSNSEAAATAQALQRYGAPTVTYVGSPSFFINIVASAHAQLYDPQWVLTDDSSDTVAGTACAAANNTFDGRVVSDIRALADRPSGLADGATEMEMLVWGVNESVHQALLATGGDLRRSTVLSKLGSAKLANGTFPPAAFRPDDHFGGAEAFLLRSDCPAGRWATGQLLPLR